MLDRVDIPEVEPADTGSGWLAELDLEFVQKRDRTILAHKKTQGPLTVQRPFYPEGDVCHVYVLHPPGGVVGGDSLNLNIKADKAAHVLLTTPGATKIYRSDYQLSHLNNNMQASDATVEWFPQETIVFDGARTSITTAIQLDPTARFIGWDIVCLGRPASQEQFLVGDIRLAFSLVRDKKPLILERLFIAGDDELLYAPWGLRSCSCFATFIATNVTRGLLDTLRETIHPPASAHTAMTLLDDVLVCRFLGHQAEQAKNYFTHLWAILRQHITDKPISTPRVWAT